MVNLIPPQLSDLKPFIIPNSTPVISIDVENAFNGLDEREQLYAYYLSLASWIGGLIVPVQVSPESPLLISFLLDLFKTNGIENLRSVALNDCGFEAENWTQFLVYSAAIFADGGNYKGYGDTKIIPDPEHLSPVLLEKLIAHAKFTYVNNGLQLFKDYLKDRIYSLEDNEKQLGFGNRGVTKYFSSNCTDSDAGLINRFMKSKGTEAWLTRVFKTVGQNGTVNYEIRNPSVKPTTPEMTAEVFEFEGAKIHSGRGDYAKILERVCYYLEKAKEYAGNENQKNMIRCYIESFMEGSLEAHKNGSRFWIKDKGPIVESYIGFIENYRDPDGRRSEFEGFVSIVNKETSKKFQALVDGAPEFLEKLPWPKEFEKDVFLMPDFTSLEVLAFSGSGVPIGINIPNYDEIRQNEGFKNVALSNIIAAVFKDLSSVNFISDSDKELFSKYRIQAEELQTGLHELLGHGSGKLLKKNEDGTLNFPENLVNPLNLGTISKMYQPGETFDSVFTSLGSPYEECRAEAIGYLLCLEKAVLTAFGFTSEEEAESIIYVNWLAGIMYSGVRSLEMYQPETRVWGQAHSQAAFVLLRVLLEAGDDLAKVEEITNSSDGKPDLMVRLDPSKIQTIGKEVLRKFLLKLQVYKSTASLAEAKEMFNNYSQVSGTKWEEWRQIVMDRKKPRRLIIQPNTIWDQTISQPKVKNYDCSASGLIQSWIERYTGDDEAILHQGLEECWKKDKPFF